MVRARVDSLDGASFANRRVRRGGMDLACHRKVRDAGFLRRSRQRARPPEDQGAGSFVWVVATGTKIGCSYAEDERKMNKKDEAWQVASKGKPVFSKIGISMSKRGAEFYGK